ncbi:ErfK/YbiS/YcfS/YnhG family protein, putative [Pediococcus damnosus]|uniref:L,D-transpeptidase family protein n=1 Tax=Pediococcus damnosus TaxID=51663 RepID=UPI00078BA8E9|nr:L,D-transpeptidase family protein [Pediococcus damnosus]AMV60169.1 ErfK/YbiS/YcfS/YnhG family protein, putative [Pediococcus damnosus]AMV64413.1 ErfK/YbiS/YcfS/YnhG family protein, putative [Pediococcus damnosus]
MRHKSKPSWRFIGLFIILLAIIYGIGAYHFDSNNRFLPNTKIAGVNVGNKTAHQASTLINKQLANRKFSITQNGKILTSFNTNQTGFTFHSSSLKSALNNQTSWSWPLHLVSSVEASKTTKFSSTTVNSSQFNKLVATETAKLNQNRTASTPASLKVSNGKVTTTDAKQGNQVDVTKLATSLKKALTNGATALKLDSSVYKTAQANSSAKTATDAKLVKEIVDEKAVINVGGHKVTIPTSDLAKWITYNNNQISLNQRLVKAYVTKIDNKYKTYGKTKTFKSTLRGTVKVSGGFYGWSIKIADETTALTQEILKGKSFEREPVIQGTGYNTKKQIIGNTYVEVDKKNQKMFIYVDGKLKLKTNVVTGLPPKQTTTTGVWSVWAKKRNTTLRGNELDGTAYASKVSYWMPIDDTGIGIHDASWQPTFGGTWYKTHGSNGCVNTPPSVMPKVYKLVALGTPVIVF